MYLLQVGNYVCGAMALVCGAVHWHKLYILNGEFVYLMISYRCTGEESLCFIYSIRPEVKFYWLTEDVYSFTP